MPRFIPLALVALLAFLYAGASFAAIDGPDGGGYRYIDSNEPNGPTFAFEDITATGTPTNAPDDSVLMALQGIPFGFSFTFYGTAYTAVNLGPNGNLQFTDDSAEATNGSIPTASFEGAAIMPFWDDLDAIECGDMYYETRGVAPAQRFIVQWTSCHNDPPTGDLACSVNLQVILFEGTNHVLMQYADTTFTPTTECPLLNGPVHGSDNGASASVGIQQGANLGLQYSFDEPVITAELAICFYADPDGEVTEGFCGSMEDLDDVCDFAIDKTNDIAGDAALAVGDTFTWTLAVNWDSDCDDVVYDITDDIPDGFDLVNVEFTHTGLGLPVPDCNDADPLICTAQTDAEAGEAIVDIEVMVSAEVCGDDNEGVVTPVSTTEAPATGASDTDTVSTADCASLTVFKSCPFGAGESEFIIEVEDAGGELLDADAIQCGETQTLTGLAAGNYTLTELINGADADSFATTIVCGDGEMVEGVVASLTIPAASEVTCVVINSLGDLTGLICPCSCGCLDLEIDIGNENTNVIGIDNDNANSNANGNENANANDNANTNVNDNANSNEQDQDNAQDQDNSNTQDNNITSSPEVNIDFE